MPSAKSTAQLRRRGRVRAKIMGTTARPRLSVKISSRQVIAQIIDDEQSKTVVYSTSAGQNLPPNLSRRAEWVGADIGKKAKSAKLKQVVFDRGARTYHGHVQKLAEAARQEGLEF